MNPSVSIILPVRNGERFLNEALSSVAGQSFTDFELVVVDDGSTDRSYEIAAGHGSVTKVLRGQAQGVPSAMNRGLQAARGRLIIFIDSDDVWLPDSLSTLFASQSGTSAVYGAVQNTNERLVPQGAPILSRMLTASLVPAEAFARVGPMRTDVAHGANVDWVSRATAAGVQFLATEKVVLLRRIHETNMGRDYGQARRDMLRVIRDHRARNRGS